MFIKWFLTAIMHRLILKTYLKSVCSSKNLYSIQFTNYKQLLALVNWKQINIRSLLQMWNVWNKRNALTLTTEKMYNKKTLLSKLWKNIFLVKPCRIVWMPCVAYIGDTCHSIALSNIMQCLHFHIYSVCVQWCVKIIIS